MVSDIGLFYISVQTFRFLKGNIIHAGLTLSRFIFILNAVQCVNAVVNLQSVDSETVLNIFQKIIFLPLRRAWRIAISTSEWVSSLILNIVSKCDFLMMSWICNRKQMGCGTVIIFLYSTYQLGKENVFRRELKADTKLPSTSSSREELQSKLCNLYLLSST